MNLVRKMLFPISIIYNLITRLRNGLYDCGFLKTSKYQIPIIAVGNLNTGGTGKSPQIEYLIRLLSDNHRVATLSRGYKRQSKGFVLADKYATAATLGDEPFQFFSKFKNIQVAVDANRINGINQLLLPSQKPKIILLDDAFQHRKVKAGLNILLTAFGDLYTNDFVLPCGNLRESRQNAQRASVIIVTKCPKNLSEFEQENIKKKLQLLDNQSVFFSYIQYDDCVFSKSTSLKISDIQKKSKLIVAGIANPKPFFDFLKNPADQTLRFADHHHFLENDIQKINQNAANRLIITTEKDFVRLKDSNLQSPLFYLPIKSNFVTNALLFDKIVLDFVNSFAEKAC